MTEHIFSEAISIASTEPVSVEFDRAVFFAGATARKAAIAFCRKFDGYQTIMATRPWRMLSDRQLINENEDLSYEQIAQLRQIICKRFCEAAEGNVTAFTKPPSSRIPRGTFFDIELPEILKNPNIETINHMPKDDFARQHGRTDLLNKVLS